MGKSGQRIAQALGIPHHLFILLRFGNLAIRSTTNLARSLFKEKRAQALFTGNAAHSILPLDRWSSAAFGLMLPTLGHAVGWPIVKGGSQAIADALASFFRSVGGSIE